MARLMFRARRMEPAKSLESRKLEAMCRVQSPRMEGLMGSREYSSLSPREIANYLVETDPARVRIVVEHLLDLLSVGRKPSLTNSVGYAIENASPQVREAIELELAEYGFTGVERQFKGSEKKFSALVSIGFLGATALCTLAGIAANMLKSSSAGVNATVAVVGVLSLVAGISYVRDSKKALHRYELIRE